MLKKKFLDQPHPATKFGGNRFPSFCVMLLTNKPTDRHTSEDITCLAGVKRKITGMINYLNHIFVLTVMQIVSFNALQRLMGFILQVLEIFQHILPCCPAF